MRNALDLEAVEAFVLVAELRSFTLTGEIRFHRGDESAFTARRW